MEGQILPFLGEAAVFATAARPMHDLSAQPGRE
jgi:hypothetical protein